MVKIHHKESDILHLSALHSSVFASMVANYCCVTNYPRIYLPQIIHICYLTQGSAIQKLCHALWSLTRVKSRHLLGLQSSEGWTTAGGAASKMGHSCGCAQEATVSCHVDLLKCPHNMADEGPRRGCNVFNDLTLTPHSTVCAIFHWNRKSALPR